MTIEFIPHDNRLLIKFDEFKDRVGQIILPNKRAEYARLATVVAVGDGAKEFKVGDRVLLSSFAGQTVHLVGLGMSDENIRIIADNEIWAWVKEK